MTVASCERSSDAPDPTMNKQSDVERSTSWVSGPSTELSDELLAWLAKNAATPEGKRRKLRIPAVVHFDAHHLRITEAVVGVAPETSNGVALQLDDGALGISLRDRLRERCTKGAGRFAHRIAAQLLLAGLEEVFAPSVVQIRSDAFASAQLGHAQLSAHPVEHDSDLLLRREPPARLATDVAHGGLTRLFLSSRHGTLLSRALALGKVSLNSEPFCIRVQLTGYTEWSRRNRG